MLQAFYNGMSGLFAFSKGLDNVSNNVSNMNTPGYRGSDTFFRSIHGQNGEGYGAGIAGTQVRTTAGEVRQTGNDTNVAINGAGFFVLKSEQDEVFFTRAGQFDVDKDGYLIESVTKHQVQGIDAAGNLFSINIKDQRTLAPTPTTKVEMIGALARSGTSDPSHEVGSIKVFDAAGSEQVLTVSFTLQQVPENSWQVDVKDADGVLLQTGQIIFGADGTPLAGFNTVNVPLTANGATQQIVLDFGLPGSYNMATQVASGASHTLSAKVVDGSAVAGLSAFSFDEKGVIKFTYTNGEKRDGSQLALADFPDQSELIASAKSVYRAPTNMKPAYGRPGEAQFGDIQGGYLELSNVDLAQEFGDILIIQRGYQASSRVMTVSNEMLEQLYNGTRGG